MPLNIAIEKLRGFVLDHDAEILAINADRIDLQIQTCTQELARRRSDQPLAFLVELTFSERHVPTTSVDGRATGEVARTQIKVSIRLKRARDRNVADVADQASAILAGIRSYLMASNATPTADGGRSRRTVNLLAPWLDLRR